MFDLLDNLVPMLILFMLLRGILDVLLGKSKRKRRQQEELPPDYEGEEAPFPDDSSRPDYEATSEPAAKEQPDLAAEFERRLKQRQQEQAQAESRERQRVYTDKAQPAKQERVYVDREQQRERQDKQRVHYDGESHHESKGRIHRNDEALQHDKSKLYRDPRGDYSYDEELFNREAAAFSARFSQQQEQKARPKLKLKHGALAQGFIMSQVLDKPRSLKPYSGEELL